jgi:hypothetical protein
MRQNWVYGLGLMALMALLTTLTTGVKAQTINPELAQTTDLGCRRVNATTGIYAQPNLTSVSQGIVTQAQIVRLESAARGWARVSQPVLGWIEAQYLSPPIACNPRIAAPAPSYPMPPRRPSPQPSLNLPPLVISKPVANGLTAVCRVTSPNGLVVRREPSLADGLYVTSLAQGDHTFTFTGQTTRTSNEIGTLTWLYITAPREGWITAGYLGQPPTLTGNRCG